MRSLPGPFCGMAPAKITNPFFGASLNSFSFCWTFVMASCTFFLVVSDFMFEAVPYSCLSMFMTSPIWRPGGTYSETSSVALPSFFDRDSSAFFSLNLSNEVRLAVVVLTLMFAHFCLGSVVSVQIRVALSK